MTNLRITFLMVFLLASCGEAPTDPELAFDAAFLRLSPREILELPLATRFGLPMGAEQGALTYNAQRFRMNRHLGDDLNGIGGWNSDLGDPVYASATGRVLYAGIPSPGWGKVVILGHRVQQMRGADSEPDDWKVYQTVYAHLDDYVVHTGDLVMRGEKLGSVGTAFGRYYAHLHFEIRESLSVYPGAGYSSAALDRVAPEPYLFPDQVDIIKVPPVGPELE